MPAQTADRYVPAAGRASLTRHYDTVLAATMREHRWRPLLAHAVLGDLRAGGVVVDVGAGSGTTAIALAAERPDVAVLAIDGDPEIQSLARAKPGAERVVWRAGLADALPVEDSSADRVVMSLLLHHLSPDGKRAALAEVGRVLRPGGRLHVADWGRAATPLMRLTFLGLQLADGFANTRDHVAGRLPSYLTSAGMSGVRTDARVRTWWGTLELLRGAI